MTESPALEKIFGSTRINRNFEFPQEYREGCIPSLLRGYGTVVLADNDFMHDANVIAVGDDCKVEIAEPEYVRTTMNLKGWMKYGYMLEGETGGAYQDARTNPIRDEALARLLDAIVDHVHEKVINMDMPVHAASGCIGHMVVPVGRDGINELDNSRTVSRVLLPGESICILSTTNKMLPIHVRICEHLGASLLHSVVKPRRELGITGEELTLSARVSVGISNRGLLIKRDDEARNKKAA